ncbi:MAG: energy transducer TonB [Ignavibacteriaceae bacterium]|nr:energy transducer TonB [Ignavibacteriaceae bacterium]
MKIFIGLIFLSITIYCQDSSINCDSLLFPEYIGYVAFERMPEPVGGYDSLQSRLVYPKEALEKNIEGKVYIRFAVDSTGNQLCARVIRGLGYGCDEETLRLVNSAKFISGFHKGKPYTMPVTIPIIFSLKDKKKE